MVVQTQPERIQAARNESLESILVTEKLSEEGVKILRKNFQVHLKYDLTPEALLQIIGDYDALIVRSGTKVRNIGNYNFHSQ